MLKLCIFLILSSILSDRRVTSLFFAPIPRVIKLFDTS